MFSRMGSDEEDLSSSVDTDDSEDDEASPVEKKKCPKTTSPDTQSPQEKASTSSKE